MDTYDGPAVLHQDNRDISIGRCAFSVRVEPLGLKDWVGQFRDVAPEHALESGEATLILPSGETGEIVIVNYENRQPGTAHGTFVGSGPAPSVRQTAI